jgi:hypothetical protein
MKRNLNTLMGRLALLQLLISYHRGSGRLANKARVFMQQWK